MISKLIRRQNFAFFCFLVRNNLNESYQVRPTTVSWKRFSSSNMSDSESKNVPISRPCPSSSPLKKKQPRGMSFAAWKTLNSNAAHAPVWPFLIDILVNFTQALAAFTRGIPKQIGGGLAAVNQHIKRSKPVCSKWTSQFPFFFLEPGGRGGEVGE